jgi:hypothetical protein
MDCYRYTTDIFRFTIAAPEREEAAALALSSCGAGVLTEWLTPDVWTGRAVEAATSAAVVDCVPRFVVERGSTLDGTRELDPDDVPARLEAGEADTLRNDSPIHAAWLDALTAERKGGAALRRHVVDVATCRDAERWPMLARALAGAYGLGPVPAWHAALLPALIALDIEAPSGRACPDEWLDLGFADLVRAIGACRAIAPNLQALALGHAGWALAAPRVGDGLAHVRAQCVRVMGTLGWIRGSVYHAVAAELASA